MSHVTYYYEMQRVHVLNKRYKIIKKILRTYNGTGLLHRGRDRRETAVRVYGYSFRFGYLIDL